MMKILGFPRNNTIGVNNPKHFSIYLTEAPEDREVIFSASPSSISAITALDFTTSNYGTPQSVRVIASVTGGFDKITLTITERRKSDAFVISSTTKDFYITQYQTGANDFGTDIQANNGKVTWKYLFPSSLTLGQIATYKTAIRDFIFKGSYPSGDIYGENVNPTSPLGVTVANAKLDSNNLWYFRENDETPYYYENHVSYVRNTDNTGKLLIDFHGHGETGHQELYNDAMGYGYDVLTFKMDKITSDNGSLSPFPHNHYDVGVDTETFCALRLFLFDVPRAMAKVLAEKTHTDIVICGVSGGAWKALLELICYFDLMESPPTIKAFLHRGVASHYINQVGDFEQGAGKDNGTYPEFNGVSPETQTVGSESGPRVNGFYTTYPYELLLLIGSTITEIHTYYDENDTVAPYARNYMKPLKELLEAKATALGGTYTQTHASATAGHGYLSEDRTHIWTTLGEI